MASKMASSNTKRTERKTPAANLTSVLNSATAEERQNAKSTIAGMDDKKKRSSLASMAHFLKSNPDELCAMSRGEVRSQYHEAMIIHFLRTKNAAKDLNIDKSFSSSKKKFVDLLWWSAFTMCKELGKSKGLNIISSNRLPTRPCFVTGSNHPDHREYGYPKDWERMTEEDLRS